MTDQQRPEDRIAELLQDIAKTYAPQSGDGSWVGRSHDLLPIARAMAEVVRAARDPSPDGSFYRNLERFLVHSENEAEDEACRLLIRIRDALSTLDSLGGEE